MKYILIGKIVNTHGLKGEVKILSDFKYKNEVFKKGMRVYIGKEKNSEIISSYRYHKIFDMITMEGYNDINQILKYKGDYIFVNKEDIVLPDGRFLNEDIIGLKVIIDNREIGIVKNIDKHSKNEILAVKGLEKDYLIPYNFDIIENVNIEKREITVKNIVGLID